MSRNHPERRGSTSAMDKRDVSALFADRLRQVVERAGGVAPLARQAGMDRSALGQFLAPGNTRLPRAEALRRLAEASGTSSDWLLGLSFAEAPERELAPAVEIEAALGPDGDSPIARWHREAAGHKIRYVPANLPDQLCLPEIARPSASPVRQAQGEATLAEIELGETDLEIAMPRQTLEAFAAGQGAWSVHPPGRRRAQLARMAALTEAHYPVLRLHLYDAARTYAAPFTVFGPVRAALYLGPGYLVLTGAEDVRRLARVFDALVRQAVVGADRAHRYLQDLASRVA
ncbi:MAG: transcriptional regulator [Pseudomonadota bacterium]